ncbi:hypothetical protein, partial [Pseudomonas sp. 2822-17]|uniref:hypothetical protein n=1 Tax=Pseudomonas sp. 2822-17 TaxID=1712678 RepID=UPI001C48A0A2
PKSPDPLDHKVWAAALHLMGVALMEGDQDEKEIADQYNVKEVDVLEAVKHMKGIESQLFLIQNDNT